MPNKQNDITITIVSKNSENLPTTSEDKGGSAKISTDNKSKITKTTNDIGNGKKLLAFAGSMAATQFIEQAKYQSNKYIRLSENYMFENTLNFAESTIKGVIGIGASAAAGAMVGGPIGAVLGGGFGILRQVVKMNETWEQQQISINENNYNRLFSATRLGLDNNSKNTLN